MSSAVYKWCCRGPRAGLVYCKRRQEGPLNAHQTAFTEFGRLARLPQQNREEVTRFFRRLSSVILHHSIVVNNLSTLRQEEIADICSQLEIRLRRGSAKAWTSSDNDERRQCVTGHIGSRNIAFPARLVTRTPRLSTDHRRTVVGGELARVPSSGKLAPRMMQAVDMMVTHDLSRCSLSDVEHAAGRRPEWLHNRRGCNPHRPAEVSR
jgi:hypothetical protein